VSFRALLRGARPFAVAHRGGAAEAPENTLAAFRAAIAAGYPWVEFDVRAAADGTPWVVHDEALPWPDGVERPVASLGVADLTRFDLAAHLGPAAAGESPPSLDAALALPWGAVRWMVEVKPTADDRGLGAETVRRCLRVRPPDGFVVASFSPDVLAGAAGVANVPLMALLDGDLMPQAFRGLSLAAWGPDRRLVGPDFLRSLPDDLPLWSWTVKDLAEAPPLLKAGVRGLISDVPGRLRAFLDATEGVKRLF